MLVNYLIGVGFCKYSSCSEGMHFQWMIYAKANWKQTWNIIWESWSLCEIWYLNEFYFNSRIFVYLLRLYVTTEFLKLSGHLERSPVSRVQETPVIVTPRNRYFHNHYSLIWSRIIVTTCTNVIVTFHNSYSFFLTAHWSNNYKGYLYKWTGFQFFLFFRNVIEPK